MPRTPGKHLAGTEVDRIIELYSEGADVKAIAATIGCGQNAVYRQLSKADINLEPTACRKNGNPGHQSDGRREYRPSLLSAEIIGRGSDLGLTDGGHGRDATSITEQLHMAGLIGATERYEDRPLVAASKAQHHQPSLSAREAARLEYTAGAAIDYAEATLWRRRRWRNCNLRGHDREAWSPTLAFLHGGRMLTLVGDLLSGRISVEELRREYQQECTEQTKNGQEDV